LRDSNARQDTLVERARDKHNEQARACEKTLPFRDSNETLPITTQGRHRQRDLMTQRKRLITQTKRPDNIDKDQET